MGLLLAGGALSGLLFDFYRMLRRQGRRNRAGFSRWLTFFSDLVFSVLVLGILIFFFREANFLEFRLYLFIVSLMGLVLYLALLSSGVKRFLARFFSLTRHVGGTVTGWRKSFFRGIGGLCRVLLAIPYEILRWFGMLVYRFGEAVLRSFSGCTSGRQERGRRQGEENQGEQIQKRTQERTQKRVWERGQRRHKTKRRK